jgi:hypothetical protein
MKIRRGIKVPGVNEPITFHVPLADADEQGNNIVQTYARKDIEDARHTQHNEHEAILQDSIEDATAKAALAKEQATSSNITSDQANKTAKSNAADYVGLTTRVAEISRDVEKLYTSPSNGMRVFMSERLMRLNLTKASLGDTCLVAKPFYKLGSIFNASQFYGDIYVGDKAEHQGEWHNLLVDAKDKIISDNGLYYQVNNTTYQTVADLTITELLEHGHIKPIAIDELGDNDPVSFYLYEYGMGGWKNTEVLASITVSPVIDTHAVYDDILSQDVVNVGNEINGLRGNINNEALKQWIDDIADILNDLQANVAYVHDIPTYRHIHHIPLIDYNIRGDNTSSTFDYSTFDNSTFV